MSSDFPLQVKVRHARYETSQVPDRVGNLVADWPQARENAVELLVFAWHIGGAEDSVNGFEVGGREERVVSDATLQSPSGVVTARDQVELPGHGWFEVQGTPGNWDANPWWSPGLDMVALRKVDG